MEQVCLQIKNFKAFQAKENDFLKINRADNMKIVIKTLLRLSEFHVLLCDSNNVK